MPDPGEVVIRCEDAEDQRGVRWVNESAFERCDESDLIEGLRREGAALLSLVAEVNEQIAGHILFSRMWIDTAVRSPPWHWRR
jgi:putative acetyltransferase